MKLVLGTLNSFHTKNIRKIDFTFENFNKKLQKKKIN